MEMHQVRYFLAVARERNFTRAAEACNVTQPSLTRAIQKLEEEFGGQLFRRERALTHLTELGRLMHPLLERSFEAAQQARTLARQVERAQVSPLALGLAADVHLTGLPGLFTDMCSTVVGLELAVRVEPPADLLDAALAGDLDVFISARDGDLPDRIDCWELRRERYGLLLPDRHNLATVDLVDPAALSGEPFVTLGAPPEQLLIEAGARPVHRAGGWAAAGLLVSAGVGAALLPEGTNLHVGTVWRPIRGCGQERTVVLAAVSGRRRSQAAEIFLKSVRARGWPVSQTLQ